MLGKSAPPRIFLFVSLRVLLLVERRAVERRLVDRRAVDRRLVDRLGADRRLVDRRAVDRLVDRLAVERRLAVDRRCLLFDERLERRCLCETLLCGIFII